VDQDEGIRDQARPAAAELVRLKLLRSLVPRLCRVAFLKQLGDVGVEHATHVKAPATEDHSSSEQLPLV
jgi:hypothetical protein